MAKRRHEGEFELPFVALMDTMTNVVGVLLIVLVMIGISIANTVKKILSDLPPVEASVVEQLRKEVSTNTAEEDNKKIDEQRKKLEELLKKNIEELKTLDVSADKQNVKFVDLDALQKKVDEAKKERDKQRTEAEKLLAQLEEMKKRLDATPKYEPPPAKIVRIPNPRPVPDGAVRENFLITKGRVIYLNDRSFLDAVVKEVEKNRANLLTPNHPRITSKTPPATIRYAKDKMLTYFDKARIGDRTIQAKVVALPTAPVFNVNLTPVENAGESAQDIRNPASLFQRAMRSIKTDPKKVAWLYVTKDSVETYLLARELADAAGAPVGWAFYSQDFYSVRLPNVTYEPFTPPPPPPPPKPDAAPVVTIKPPKESLD